MDDQIKQIIDKKVTQAEATTILAFAILETLKQLAELEKKSEKQRDQISDLPIIRKLVFGAVGVILLTVLGAIIALAVSR